jgi:isopentenyl-diphosphate Delta-isomerase
VFVGRTSDPVRVDPSEIVAWRWISPEALQGELAGREAVRFTPWFVMEWERILRDHRGVLTALSQ